MKMRKLLAAGMAAALILGCVPAWNVSASETSVEAEAETASKKHVENLVIGTTSVNDTFNLTSQSGAFGRINYNCIANAYFAYTDENNEVQPYFLTSYEISEDGTELAITFPTDKVWHDGTPVTAEDVQFTFEYYRDVVGNSYIKNLESIEVTGENSMTLKFSSADAYSYMANGATSQSMLPNISGKTLQNRKIMWERMPISDAVPINLPDTMWMREPAHLKQFRKITTWVRLRWTLSL